ncbi:MAG: penicillin-binding transpeptidase domain-containing protein, partial [Pseudomonadota bacterium]
GLAMDRGLIHAETLIDDVPTRFGGYRPKNFGEDLRGTVTIREALAASLNIPAVKVLDRLGPGHLIGRLSELGAAPTLPDATVPDLAVALGGLGYDLRTLVTLYAALARGGDHQPLTWLQSDAENAKTATDAADAQKLMSPNAAYEILRILRAAPPPPNARGGRIAFKTG